LCTNTIGSFTCACKTGYSGNGVTCNGTFCSWLEFHFQYFFFPFPFFFFLSFFFEIKWNIDINECSTNNGGCATTAKCTNTIGSFTCACNSGYDGDGFNCEG